MSSTKTEIYRTSSSEETQEAGHNFAAALLRAQTQKRSSAVVVALQGDLGAGKTTFTQGFLKGLGTKKRVASPTFILMRRHNLSHMDVRAHSPQIKNSFKDAFHIDAYRLKGPDQFTALDFESIVRRPDAIIVIEWPERAKNILPKDAIRILFKHGKKENERTIIIKK